ncbi:HEAT repeat domain-containing protein [bacterium]|nr:HEAT repeat domain-containing protein [bacterium]
MYHINNKRTRFFCPLVLYIAACLFAGFIFGEIMGGVFVAESNRQILSEQEWLEYKGYLAVPGTILRPEIKSWKTYLAGGLFFALSIGLCYAFSWGLFIWLLSLWPKILAYTSAGILGTILALFVSTPGYRQVWAFGLFLFTLPLILLAILPIFSPGKDRKAVFFSAIPFVAGFLAAMLAVYIFITPSLSSDDFTRIRDGLLERTSMGRAVTRFYYQYTLYPARVIQSYSQRLQGLLKIEDPGFTETEIKRLKDALAWRDIFIGEDAPAATILKKDSKTGKLLFLGDSPRFRIEADIESFLSDPRPLLKEYSGKADHAVFLRESVKWSLFFVLPALLIFLVFGLLNILFSLLSGLFFSGLLGKNISRTGDILMTFLLMLCLIAGLRFLIAPGGPVIKTEDLLAVIEGKRPGDKITAAIEVWGRLNETSAKPEDFTQHFMGMLGDSDPNIRKWGICFFALAGDRKASRPLISLLNDPHIVVAYHAARALGTIHAKEAKAPLLKVLKGEYGWYLKTTAYIALRKIGWSQS